jgi:DnaA family protein
MQQQELIDLYNQIKHTQAKLIISAHNLPTELNLLKDLKPRLSLAVNFRCKRCVLPLDLLPEITTTLE